MDDHHEQEPLPGAIDLGRVYLLRANGYLAAAALLFIAVVFLAVSLHRGTWLWAVVGIGIGVLGLTVGTAVNVATRRWLRPPR